MSAKYNIGDFIYWVESSTHYNKKIPCTVCFGKKFVTIVLGDDSHSKIECGFCQSGCDAPNGYATSWEPDAVIKSGEISGLSIKHGIRYEVGYKTIEESEVYTDKDLAEKERIIQFNAMKKRADKWFLDSFKSCTKKQSWSTGYHKKCIKEAERTIEWHNKRLLIIKANQVK